MAKRLIMKVLRENKIEREYFSFSFKSAFGKA
jgi:hypothetical protein